MRILDDKRFLLHEAGDAFLMYAVRGKSWIAMGELAFPERPITEGTPESRNGFLTFGTANNPYKYSKEMIRTWAQITAAVPGAKFMFVRPECGSPSFRTNMIAQFADLNITNNKQDATTHIGDGTTVVGSNFAGPTYGDTNISVWGPLNINAGQIGSAHDLNITQNSLTAGTTTTVAGLVTVWNDVNIVNLGGTSTKLYVDATIASARNSASVCRRQAGSLTPSADQSAARRRLSSVDAAAERMRPATA